MSAPKKGSFSHAWELGIGQLKRQGFYSWIHNTDYTVHSLGWT